MLLFVVMLQNVLRKVEAVLETAFLEPRRFDYFRRTGEDRSNMEETDDLSWPVNLGFSDPLYSFSSYSIPSALSSWKTLLFFF